MLKHPTLDQLQRPRPPWNGQGLRRTRRRRPSRRTSTIANGSGFCSIARRHGGRTSASRRGCASPNCASRRASKMSTIEAARGLDRALFQKLVEGDWIDAHDNLALVGPTGVGKSWLACALGHKACRDNRSVLYQRGRSLFEDLALARGDGRHPRSYASPRPRRSSHSRRLGALSRSTPARVTICWKSSKSDTAADRRSSPPSSRSTAGMKSSATRRFHDASLLDRLVRRTLALSTTAWSGDSEICQGMPLASCVPVSHPFRSQSNMTCGVMPMAAAAPWTE